MSDEQVEDRIDDALEYYRDFHHDGTERFVMKYKLTDIDLLRRPDEGTGRAERYISFKDTEFEDMIQGVINVYPFESSYRGANNLFNLEYQLFRSEVFAFSSQQLLPYVMVKRHIETLQEILVGDEIFNFNRHTNRLYLDGNWDSLVENTYILIDCYVTTDPDTYKAVWNDPWLKRYATALTKRQWGSNLSKFSGIALPGNVTLDGPRILQEANEEISELETRMITDFELPPMMEVG